MSSTGQTYQTHRQFVPLFHFFVLPVLLLNVLFMAYRLVTGPSLFEGWALLMALALLLAALFGRVFALKVQDRLIRLEERLRLREVLPPDLGGRIADFSCEQLIALRFASDAELPELAAAVLRDNVQKREDIKKMVKDWRADTVRA